MSYNFILSHTFPGILLELEIFLAFHLYSPVNITEKISFFANANVTNLVCFIAIFFVFATILGFIIDGIHHYIFSKYEEETNGIFKYINTIDKMQIVRALLDDDQWYPYEAFANIWIAMIPGILLIPSWMIIRNFHYAFIICFMVIYLTVFIIMRSEALKTLEIYKKVEIELITAFTDSGSSSKKIVDCIDKKNRTSQ